MNVEKDSNAWFDAETARCGHSTELECEKHPMDTLDQSVHRWPTTTVGIFVAGMGRRTDYHSHPWIQALLIRRNELWRDPETERSGEASLHWASLQRGGAIETERQRWKGRAFGMERDRDRD